MDERLAELFAESGIRQLWSRYADALWRKDIASFGDCFADDAVWKIVGIIARGRSEIVETFAASLEPTERVMMRVGNSLLQVDGGVATGRTQVSELIKRKDGSALRTLGVYFDRFVETAGVWRFKWHHFNLHYLGPPDLSGNYLEVMEYGPPPGFPGPDDWTPVPAR